MSITGNFVDADEALRIGLVNHVVPHDDLLPATAQLAAEVATTGAVTEVLRLYRRGEDVSLADALALEAEHTRHRTLRPGGVRCRGQGHGEATTSGDAGAERRYCVMPKRSSPKARMALPRMNL